MGSSMRWLLLFAVWLLIVSAFAECRSTTPGLTAPPPYSFVDFAHTTSNSGVASLLQDCRSDCIFKTNNMAVAWFSRSGKLAALCPHVAVVSGVAEDQSRLFAVDKGRVAAFFASWVGSGASPKRSRLKIERLILGRDCRKEQISESEIELVAASTIATLSIQEAPDGPRLVLPVLSRLDSTIYEWAWSERVARAVQVDSLPVNAALALDGGAGYLAWVAGKGEIVMTGPDGAMVRPVAKLPGKRFIDQVKASKTFALFSYRYRAEVYCISVQAPFSVQRIYGNGLPSQWDSQSLGSRIFPVFLENLGFVYTALFPAQQTAGAPSLVRSSFLGSGFCAETHSALAHKHDPGLLEKAPE
jgi:hypothetical protein